MRMGSGGIAGLLDAEKEAGQDILDSRAQGKNSAPKLGFILLDPSSLSFLLP